MHAVERLSSYISRGVYNVSGPFHPFGGAVDIIVVEQKDGTFKSSPWYVRFGKFQGVLKTTEKVIDISVNGVQTDLQMYLDHKGEAYFLNEVVREASHSILYPSSSGDETDEQQPHSYNAKESHSCHFGANGLEIANQVDLSNGKILDTINPQHCILGANPQEMENQIDLSNEMIVGRSRSRRSRILGLVFGQTSMRSDRVKEEEGRASSLERAELAADLLDVNWSTNLGAPSNSKNNKNSSSSPMKITPGELVTGSYSDFDHNQLICDNDGSVNVNLGRICDFGSGESKYFVEESVAHVPSLSRLELGVEMCTLRDLEENDDNSASCREKSILHCQSLTGDSNGGFFHISSMNSKEAAHSSKNYSPQEPCALFSNKRSNTIGVFRDNNVSNFIEDAPNNKNIGMGSTIRDGVVVECDSSVIYNAIDKQVLDEMLQDTTISRQINLKAKKVEAVRNSFEHENVPHPNIDGVVDPLHGSPEQADLRSVSTRYPLLDYSHELNFDFGLEPSALSEEGNSVFRDIAEVHVKDPCCCSSPEREKHHNLDNDFGELIENPKVTSSPINIPTSHRVLKQEVGNLVKSLPNIWYHAESGEFFHPISQSVASTSKSLDSTFHKKESLDCMNLDADKKCQLTQDRPTVEDNQISVEHQNVSLVAPSGTWRIWPFSFKNPKTKIPPQTTQSVFDVENTPNSSVGMDVENYISKIDVTKMKIRTVTPTSEQMASLNLQQGRNIVTFTFSTKVLGKQQVDARIYLWKWNTQIVISDVDGTITKSDVLGHFMPLVGYDWSHTGVAHLFTAIKENGYQLLFLSARAISQAYHTRQFLFNLKQDGKVLPDGPVVISPDGFFPSLFREVFRRAPHEFKIACLEDIKALFPSDCNPFYAGFGNRDTDEISYIKVGIPKGKIFIINPKGEVAVNRCIDTKSYMSLHALVNGMFPPMSSSEQEDYNSWNYWRLPSPSIQA